MADWREFEEGSSNGTRVRGFLHSTTVHKDAVVLTHGAGSDSRSVLLVQLSTALAEIGFTVLRCDLPFRQLRPTGPPRGSSVADQQGLRAATDAMRHLVPGRVFLGGHSYGGRQATMLVAADHGIADGLLLLSYPLHPPKNRDQLRTSHFPEIRRPALFAHGTQDGFGSVEEMTAALRQIPARTRLLPIDNARHELISARTALAVSRTIATEFAAFVDPGASAPA